MATRILVYSGSRVVGRCDSRCHDAHSKTCHCICGGRLHGTGEDVHAVDMAEVDVSGALDEFAERNEYDVGQLEVKTTGYVQLRLFPVRARQAVAA